MTQVPVKALESVRDYFRSPDEPNRIFAKGKKIEVVYAIVSKGIPLLRTEGVGDISLLDLKVPSKGTVAVPVILPEKIQAKLRRQMLEILRAHFNDTIKGILINKYKNNNYKKLGDGSWNCYIAPPLGERETDIGMCGFCPTCNIMGTIITNNELEGAETSYGLKSRVVHDIAYALVEEEKAVVDMTHTKVGEGVSYTGRSLYEESHVLPGVVFVGKTTLYDVTELEAKLVLAGLASIKRMGAGETKYGAVQSIILGIKGSRFETISSYDIARRVFEDIYKESAEGKAEDLLEPETYIEKILKYLEEKGFHKLIDLRGGGKIDDIGIQLSMTEEEIKKLWEIDNYHYADEMVRQIKRIEGKLEEETKGRRKKTEAEKK